MRNNRYRLPDHRNKGTPQHRQKNFVFQWNVRHGVIAGWAIALQYFFAAKYIVAT